MSTISCPTENAKLSEVTSSIEDRATEIIQGIENEAKADTENLKKDMPSGEENKIGIDIKFNWTDKEFSFHIPTVKLEDQVIGSLHLPEFKMENKDIVFYTPSVKMVDKKVGEYPTVVCRGFSCHTEMKDIIISVPETFQQEHKITLGIPSVTMKQQDIIMGIPVFGTQLQKFVLSIPEIEMVSISQISAETKKKSEELNEKYSKKNQDVKAQIRDLIIKEVEPAHTDLFNCIKSGVSAMKSASITPYESTITTLNTGISNLQAQGVPSDNASLKQMEESLRVTTEQRDKQVQLFDSKLDEIEAQRKSSFETIINQIDVQS
ncbi:hypothetical protein [Paenibacillus sp. Aloe-11]|uniref:hypothetical protein n=1 Tax=Paenibacillus sp. Aloe-11 TaxID=1050222 RepID=UPI0002D6070D|nr:hypothetical protein [Paenibacillus sp. Aloe-11]